MSFPTKITLFHARNSEGKTNLLEAIYYLSSLSSPRNCHPQEMIRHGASGFSIKGRVEDRTAERDLTVYFGEFGRRLWMGGKRISQPGMYCNRLAAVMFSPDDIALIAEGHELRRRFLDRCLALGDAAYLQEMGRLRRILIQRNRLLKLRDKRQLPFWDEQMVSSWGNVYRGRMGMVSKLNREIPPILNSLGGEKEVKVRYRPLLIEDSEFSSSHLLRHLREHWDEEMRAGFSLFGPHRDEVLVELDGYDARRFSSRGEKRLLTLSLKIFELYHIQQVRGEPPVILLDDIFSELDETRKEKVAGAVLAGGQAMVSCTDMGMAQPLLPGAGIYRIQGGRVEWANQG